MNGEDGGNGGNGEDGGNGDDGGNGEDGDDSGDGGTIDDEDDDGDVSEHFFLTIFYILVIMVYHSGLHIICYISVCPQQKTKGEFNFEVLASSHIDVSLVSCSL